MPSIRRRKSSPRRQMFLKLAGQIESQLRDAYAQKNHDEKLTQSAIAKSLNVGRAEIHHRLMGGRNMTTETIADMVWALGYDIYVRIFDPKSCTISATFFMAEDGDDAPAPVSDELHPKGRAEFELAP